MRAIAIASPVLALLLACGPAGAEKLPRDAGGFPAPDRPVAEIVSPIWSSEAERDAARETEQVFAAAGVRAGQTVADIGAGSGYYVVRLSPVVGPAGRVYAEDVTPKYLAALDARVKALGLPNVTLVQGTADDPKLPSRAIDTAFLIHMYHEIAQPYGLLHRLAGAMKPGGRVVITDADRQPEHHGMPPALLKCELEAVGYRRVSMRTLDGGVGYLAIFEAPAANTLPAPQAITPCRLAR